MSIVVRKLVAKELYVNRWFMLASAVAAVLSIGAASFGGSAYNIAAITWLTTVVAWGVMLAIYGISNERKENTLQFVLSMPLSPAEYVRAKVFGLLLTYSLPWLAASGSALALVLLSPLVPDGLLPYVVLLCVFLFANFTVVICGAVHARSDAMVAGVIILTNMMVSLFMFAVGARPGIKDHMYGPTPVWNDTFFNLLSLELIVSVIAVALPLATAARRRDFI
jgi:ABC-type transport system involved in multi-copper enzyme maturation permease subunit